MTQETFYEAIIIASPQTVTNADPFPVSHGVISRKEAGLELSVSVVRAGLLGQATGSSIYFTSDVVARAKRNLSSGEMLDGEGGYTVYGRLRPAALAVQGGELPVGLSYDMRLKRPIGEGEVIHWADVEYDESAYLIRLRREMEAKFAERHPSR